MEQALASIVSTEETNPGVYLAWIQAPQIAKEAIPGQFVTVRCSNGSSPLLRRPLSIHRVRGGQIALLFEVVGQGTEWLSRQSEGNTIDLLGPLGKGFSLQRNPRNVLLIAGGIGIAPLVFLADSLLEQGRSATLLMGAQTSVRLYPEHLLPPSLNVFRVTDDGSQGSKGMVTDFVYDFAHQADQAFACGPISMYRSLLSCHELLQTPVQISMDVMMGCGVGACYGCTIKTTAGPRRVCSNGPVFDLTEPCWEEIEAI